MTMLYKIVLFLLILGGVSHAINASGIFPVTVPEQTIVGPDQAQITDITNSSRGPLSPLADVSMLALFVGSIMSAVLAVFTIIPLGMAWGIPFWIMGIFQAPLWWIEVTGVYSWWTGKQVED